MDQQGPPADSNTEIHDDEDHTVMVDRVAGTPAQVPSDDEDHTVMVDRVAGTPAQVPSDDEDHTVMVDRVAGTPAQVPSDDEDEDDHTVAVDRLPGATPQTNQPAQPVRPIRSQRRRGIAPPPVPAGFAPRATEASGADTRERYRPRDIPAPPPPSPPIIEGPAATREASATMPSVARHARITARVAVVVFAASCVASVVGLTLIAIAVF